MKKMIGSLLATLGASVFSLSVSAAPVPRTAFVHLFEWQWNDVAAECENVLGPKGFAAVQVSPPQKSIDGEPWYTRYQPVSYAIEGRSGNRSEFASMVSRCKAVGVDIYVDAVINHMAALDRNFPEVPYGPNDFHTCFEEINYQNRDSVQFCDLVGLNDLKTGSEYVRSQIAGYLNDLIGLGVAGFRLDASKHMPAGDIANIISRLNGNPYIFQEVIGAAGEAVQPPEYLGNGDVTEFSYEREISRHFKNQTALKNFNGIENRNGWLNSDSAVVFVANHDDQRQNTAGTLTFFDFGNLYNLGHIFSLAYPYGYPKVMSSYDFATEEQGPPSTGASNCNNGWVCEHRNPGVANMVAFRNNTADAFFVSDWWDNGNNQIAFGRGGKGFVVINREDFTTINRTFRTGMPAGEYCDIINGDFDFNTGVCTGPTITVDSNTNAFFGGIDGLQAAAIHVGAVVGVPCTDCGGNGTGGPDPSDCSQPSMNLRGTSNAFNPEPMSCVDGVWEGSATFGASSTERFKFDVFGDWATNFGDNNADGTAEAGGGDIAIGTAGTYDITFNDNTLAYTVTLRSGPVGGGDDVTVSFECNSGFTVQGQSVYVIGDQSEIGNWNPAEAVKLDPTNYPTWTGDILLPENTTVSWKCLKRNETDPNAGIEWQGGNDNVVNTGTSNTSSSGSF